MAGLENDVYKCKRDEFTLTAPGQYIQVNDGTDEIKHFISHGSPEGVVTADIGSQANDSTNGDIYRKTTDGTNTGWKALADVTGVVNSVSGTADRITISGTATDPVVDIAATYVGQTSLTTLGTVTTGTWNGSVISEAYGGTNQSTYATGDILYASGANTLAKLTAGTDGYSLTLVAGVPNWQQVGIVQTISGTTNRINLSGTPENRIINISSNYVGQATITTLGTVTTGTWNADVISEPYGGTNQSTYATGDILYASAANTLSKLSAGSNTEVLTLAGGVPTWAAPSSSSVITITALDNTDSPYTVLLSDYYMSCDTTSGVLTVNLPNAPTTGTVFIVKDSAGTADTNNITITTVGGVVTIDGATTYVMNTEYESASLVFNGTSYEVF